MEVASLALVFYLLLILEEAGLMIFCSLVMKYLLSISQQEDAQDIQTHCMAVILIEKWITMIVREDLVQ